MGYVLLFLFVIFPILWALSFYFYEIYLTLWLIFDKKPVFSVKAEKVNRNSLLPTFTITPDFSSFEISLSKKSSIRGHIYQGNSDKVIVFAHGLGQTQVDMYPRALSFIQEGWSAVFFDFPGYGESIGNKRTLGCLEVGHLAKVMDYVKEKFPTTKECVLYGVSMGAAAAAVYSSQDSHLTALVLDSIYSSVIKMLRRKVYRLHIFPQWACERLLQDVVELTEKFAKFKITNFNPEYSLMRTSVPVLLLHGDADRVVSPSMPYNIYKKRVAHSKTRLYYFANVGFGEAFNQNNEFYNQIVMNFLKERTQSLETFSGLASVNSPC